jgi:uncharacterized membrane protein YdjX (TVP38/TMEM64 family)
MERHVKVPAKIGRHAPLAFAALALTALGLAWVGRDWLSIDRLAEYHAALAALRETHFAALLAGFFAAYVLAALVSVPGIAVLSVLGGYLFGGLGGAFVVVGAATIGATGLFLATRAGLGDRLMRRWGPRMAEGRLGALGRGLRQNEVQALLLWRLVPVVPFFVANMVPALLGVRLRNYIFTTAAGIFPGTLLFTAAGGGLAETLAAGGRPELSSLAPLVLAVLPVMVAAILFVRIARRGQDAPLPPDQL